MSKYIDLTQTFDSDMPVYPGNWKPELKQVATIEKDGWSDYEIKTGVHIGTHMDGPLHMIANGKKISEINPENFFGRGILIDARGKERIDASFLENTNTQAGYIVLVLTGFGQKFHDADYYEKYPELTEDFAQKLVELKVKMVGTDTPTPDRPPFAVHKILLSKEILILENLSNLEQLIDKQFEVIALPLKFNVDSALARVVAKII
ncbi:MAG TPA: cyclase family protein [Patescibacteria group bacterium]|nr:cyclase family protein [Patescibacteria group bacterium]